MKIVATCRHVFWGQRIPNMILWPRFRSGPHGGSLQCSLDRAVEFGRLESEARKGRERGEEGGEKRGKKTC